MNWTRQFLNKKVYSTCSQNKLMHSHINLRNVWLEGRVKMARARKWRGWIKFLSFGEKGSERMEREEGAIFKDSIIPELVERARKKKDLLSDSMKLICPPYVSSLFISLCCICYSKSCIHYFHHVKPFCGSTQMEHLIYICNKYLWIYTWSKVWQFHEIQIPSFHTLLLFK